jgi:hypothetical protein
MIGAGFGIALPATMNAAIGRLDAQRSGVGSALVAATRQIGGTFGVAVLGSTLSAAYRGSLPGPGATALPGSAADGVTAGLEAAARLGSPELADAVRAAFLHGFDVLLVVSAAIAAVSAAIAAVLLPRER